MAAAAEKMEQMFLDGTHPALHRDAAAAATLRAESPERERSPEAEDRHDDGEGEDDEQPRFSAVDPDPPRGGGPAPLREATNAGGGGGGRRRGEESRNTGVKGVRADYAEAMLAQQEQPSPTGGGGGLARKMEQSLSLSRRRRQQEEDDELALLRQKRLAQLQGSGERHRDGVTRAGRLFGHLSEVGMEGFVAAVEEEDPETAVVVHLYEPVRRSHREGLLGHLTEPRIPSCL